MQKATASRESEELGKMLAASYGEFSVNVNVSAMLLK